MAAYYAHALSDRDEALAEKLRQRVLDIHAPTVLRTELATLLIDMKLMVPPDITKLLAPENPAPLRLMAADSLLASGIQTEAVTCLRNLAKLANREIALAVGQIVQRRMSVDLGIDLQHPPAPTTRKAAEITRRVMEWAAESATDAPDDDADRSVMPHPPSRPETQWDIDLPPKPGRGGSGLTPW
ncbi:MAG: hypothetical protein U0746_15640 [Gemmataceae bacterium]